MANLNSSDIKTFIGSKNFDKSLDFYVVLGWTQNFDTGGIAEPELGGCRFYLQKYYQRKWCDNSMLHITVEDAHTWFEHVTAVLGVRSHMAQHVFSRSKSKAMAHLSPLFGFFPWFCYTFPSHSVKS